MTCIDATGLSFRQVNEAIAAAKDADVLLEHALGQRYIGAGSAGRRIRIEGVPGNALGAYLDRPDIDVLFSRGPLLIDRFLDGLEAAPAGERRVAPTAGDGAVR